MGTGYVRVLASPEALGVANFPGLRPVTLAGDPPVISDDADCGKTYSHTHDFTHPDNNCGEQATNEQGSLAPDEDGDCGKPRAGTPPTHPDNSSP